MYLNKVVYSGRLVRTPEVHQSSRNKLVQFYLRQERSCGKDCVEDIFLLCEAWKTYAEDIARNYKEGETMQIEGYLRPYQDKNILMVEKYEKVKN